MTDRVRTIIVTLDHDMRDDDAGELVAAIGQLRNVAHVDLGPVVDVLGRRQARRELAEQMRAALERWLSEGT